MAGEWHPDPTGRHQYRWWDGQEWTDQVADHGVIGVDPVLAQAPAAAASPVADVATPSWSAAGAPVAAATPGGYAAVPAMYIATGPVVGAERVPAGTPLTNPWARLGAALLDVVLIIVTLFIGWVVWTLIVWSKGQTPAKQICGQRVVMKQTGQAARWGEMALRDFVIRGLAIGILGQLTCGIVSLVAALMIFSAYHETLWDKWAGTLVVDDREGRTLAAA
jgi:uncharacterized RDD family membrane protein YckC